MANQKLNEVTTVPTASINNVKTFLAVMKDGSIQQMSKEDMATVLGGLLTSKGLYPFQPFGNASTVNPNKSLRILKSGMYGIAIDKSSVTDEMEYPDFTGDIYGVLCVFAGSDLISQLLITTRGRWTRSGTLSQFNSKIISWASF